MIYIYYGGAGTGKTTAILDEIKKSVDEDKTVMSVIPEQHSFVYEEKIYNLLGAEKFHKTSCHSFTSLTREILKKFGAGSLGMDYASDISKYTILYKSIKNVSDELIYYRKKCMKKEFISDMFNLINILRKAQITPALMFEKLQNAENEFADKSYDICLIYNEYLKQMNNLNKKDLTTDLTEAARIADENKYFSGIEVFADEFESFSEDQYAVLEHIISTCDNFYIALRTDNPFSENDSLFMSGNITFSKIRELAKKYNIEFKIKKFEEGYRFKNNQSLYDLGKYVFKAGYPDERKSDGIEIFESDNIYSEVDYIAATIRQLVINKKAEYKDIAVLSNDLSVYAMHLETAFRRYNIPYNLSIRKSAVCMPFLQYISALAEMITREYPSTEAVLRYAKTKISDLKDREIAELEKYVYIWNVKDKQWLEDFPVDSFDENEKKSTERANKIRAKLIAPIEKLANDCKGKHKIKEYSKFLLEFLDNQNIDVKLQKLSFNDEKVEQSMEFVWNKFIEIINSINEVCAEDETEISEFCDLIITNAERIQFEMPPMMIDNVEIADAQISRISSKKYIFIPGVNEDLFPLINDEKSLFTDAEKKLMSEYEMNIFSSQQHIYSDACLTAYKALSAASDGVYLTYPLSSINGQKVYPADAVTRIEKIFNGSNIIKKYNEIPIDYYATTIESAYYHYVLLGQEENEDKKLLESILRKSEEYSQKIDYLKNMSSIPEYKIHNVELLNKVIGNRIVESPSSIENYQNCPFAYFCKKILRIYKVQHKDIDSAMQGTVIHYILEKALSNNTKDVLVKLTDVEIKEIVRKYGDEYFSNQLKKGFSINSRTKTSFDRIVDKSSKTLGHIKKEFEVSKFAPSDFELEIGNKDGENILEYKLSNGNVLAINGKVDRVDTVKLDDNRKVVRIVDYKTGSHLFNKTKIYNGFDCQMFLYLFSITEDGNKYSGYIPGGVLYMQAGILKDKKEKQSIDDYINSNLSMSGVLLNDPVIINAMENDSKAVYIPVTVKGDIRKGEKESMALSEDEMNILKEYISTVVKKTGENIYSGEFNCNPYSDAKKSACDYCDYKEICRVSSNIDVIARNSENYEKNIGFIASLAEKIEGEVQQDDMD